MLKEDAELLNDFSGSASSSFLFPAETVTEIVSAMLSSFCIHLSFYLPESFKKPVSRYRRSHQQ